VVIGDYPARLIGQALLPKLAPLPVFTIEGKDGFFSDSEGDAKSQMRVIGDTLSAQGVKRPGSITWIISFSGDNDVRMFSRWMIDQGYLLPGDVILNAPPTVTPSFSGWQEEVQNSNVLQNPIWRGSVVPTGGRFADRVAEELVRPQGIENA